MAALGFATLIEQTEHLRITHEALTIEEIYRLWPAFQAHYRPSSAFQVSVVVIQDTTEIPQPKPPQTRRVLATTARAPVISGVTLTGTGSSRLLTITGANFYGDVPGGTVVQFDGGGAPVAPGLVQDTLIKVAPPSALPAGTHVVRILRNLDLPGEPPPPLASNIATFQVT
jgi:hypothetical protein